MVKPLLKYISLSISGETI